jgi:hypothetical protein
MAPQMRDGEATRVPVLNEFTAAPSSNWLEAGQIRRIDFKAGPVAVSERPAVSFGQGENVQ